MGNVLSSTYSSSTASKSKMFEKPENESPPTQSEPIETIEEEKSSELGNPGTAEQLHAKCQNVKPVPFEGAKFSMNRYLSQQFCLSHNFILSKSNNSMYHLGVTYVESLDEGYPVWIGDIGQFGFSNATIVHMLSSRLRCRYMSHIRNRELAGLELTADYFGDTYTTTFNAVNPSAFEKAGAFALHHLQSVTPNLTLGVEFLHQMGPRVPGGHDTCVAALGRYLTSDNAIWSAMVGMDVCNLYYYKKASDEVRFGVEWETNFKAPSSVATISYQIDVDKPNYVFRGSVDTDWNVTGVIERKLGPYPLTFLLSGRLNHVTNRFHLGAGLVVG